MSKDQILYFAKFLAEIYLNPEKFSYDHKQSYYRLSDIEPKIRFTALRMIQQRK